MFSPYSKRSSNLNLPTVDSDEEFESDDEDYTSEIDSESDSEDDESVSSEESAEEDHDAENDEEEDDHENSDMDHMYSDKENLSPLIDVFSLSSPKTSFAFRDFVSFLLETHFHCGLELNDDVTCLLEEWMSSQVKMSFHADPECWLTRGGVPPLGFLNELFLVTSSEEEQYKNKGSDEYLTITETQKAVVNDFKKVPTKKLMDFDHSVVNHNWMDNQQQQQQQQSVVVQNMEIEMMTGSDQGEREKMALLHSLHGANTYNTTVKPYNNNNDNNSGKNNTSDNTPQYNYQPQLTTNITNSNMKTPISSYVQLEHQQHYLEVDDEVSRDSATLSGVQGSAETVTYDIQNDDHNINTSANNNNSRQIQASLQLLKDRRILYLEQRLRDMERENRQQQRADFTSPLVAMFNMHNPPASPSDTTLNTAFNTTLAASTSSLRTPLQALSSTTMLPFGSPQPVATPVQSYTNTNNNTSNTISNNINSSTTADEYEEVFALSPNVTLRSEQGRALRGGLQNRDTNNNNDTNNTSSFTSRSSAASRGGARGSVSTVGFGSPLAVRGGGNSNAGNVNTPDRYSTRTPLASNINNNNNNNNNNTQSTPSFPIYQDSPRDQLLSANSVFQNAMREASSSTPARNTRNNNNTTTATTSNTPVRVTASNTVSNTTTSQPQPVVAFNDENDITQLNLAPHQPQSVGLFSPQPVARRRSIARNDRSEF
eukprot:gene21865-27941_t